MSVRRFPLLVAVAVLAIGTEGPRAARATDDPAPTGIEGWWSALRDSACEDVHIRVSDPAFDGASVLSLMNQFTSGGDFNKMRQVGDSLVGEVPPQTQGYAYGTGTWVSFRARLVDDGTLEITWLVNGAVTETVRYQREDCSTIPQAPPTEPPTEEPEKPQVPEKPATEEILDAWLSLEPGRPTPGIDGEAKPQRKPTAQEIADWPNKFREVPPPPVEKKPEAPPTPPPPEPAGSLVGTVTVMPNKRENGGGGSFTAMTFTEDTAKFEHVKPQDSYRWGILWTYDGVPPSLRPGEEYHVTVTWEILDDTPPTQGAYEVLGGVVAISGDVEVLSAQPSGRDNKVGRYKLRVKPSAKTVRIELGGSPFGTFAIWSYERK